MDRKEIKKLSEKKYQKNNFNSIQNILKNSFEISYGKYEYQELKKAINEQKPFYIDNNFIIGYKNDNTFINDENEEIKIERMVKAIIVENEKEESYSQSIGESFVIVGKNQWDSGISEFMSILGNLKVGALYLPPHSAIFNFLEPTEEQKKKKIVSLLQGVNINIFEKENYVDNAIHEIGHLFWRDCVKFDEKKDFVNHWKHLKPSAIYEYEWERSSEEEVFCTIYKWYVKSLLINPSFRNILEYEDNEGFKLLLKVLDRKLRDKVINDIWETNKDALMDLINPPLDLTTGKRIVKKGIFEAVKDIELPDSVLNDVDRFEDGIMYVNLNKAVVPVDGNKIYWSKM
jgi:hypothetical protein